MKRVTNEIKAGILIMIAIAVCVFFFIRTSTFKTGTYDLKAYFGYAGGLSKDAAVKLSGIEVGRLKELKIVYLPETTVECLFEVDENAKIRTDSIAYIATSGFMGDAHIGITPGTSEEFIRPGGKVPSEDPMQMRLFMKKAEQIADNLDKTLAAVKDVVVDNKQSMANIIVNLEGTTENFKEFSADIKKNPWKLLFRSE
jgi:phospholipid/cholesterol/gamma-HCH transport system substrate-binding protein